MTRQGTQEVAADSAPQVVQAAPIPVTVSWGQVPRGTMTSTGPLSVDAVLLKINSFAGEAVYFLPHEIAKQIADGFNAIISQIAIAPAGIAAQLAAQAKVRFGGKS